VSSFRDPLTGIPDPDWARTLVQSQSNLKPVGDPTRWGSRTLTQILSPPGIGELGSASSQVMQAATRDAYSRCWALNGTISLPSDFWDELSDIDAYLHIDLQCQMGVGQAQVLHQICLFDNSAGPGGEPTGLCWQQERGQGGPYSRQTTATLSANPAIIDYTYAFCAIGALVGNTINIRANYLYGYTVDPDPFASYFPLQSALNLVLTPFAAGEGL